MKMRPLVLCVLLAFSSAARAGRPPAPDSTETGAAPGVRTAPPGTGRFIELEEIGIQGEIEKPSVIVLPKRIGPELESDTLGRSFREEIGNSSEVPEPDEAIGRVEPAPSIKKQIQKKRK